MLVKDWMTAGSINVGLEAGILDAADIMRRKNIRQLPVIDKDGRLMGIISDRDVRDAMPSKFLPLDGAALSGGGLAELKVKDVMTPDPVTISPDNTVETAAERLLRYKIGGLPVVDEHRSLVGIITEIDVFKFMSAATGVARSGIQLVFQVDDTAGTLVDLLGELKELDIRLTSVLTTYERALPGTRKVSVRVQGSGNRPLEDLVALLRQKHTLLYYVVDGKAVALK